MPSHEKNDDLEISKNIILRSFFLSLWNKQLFSSVFLYH